MTSDNNTYRPDVPFRPAGVGMGSANYFACMGCHQNRPTTGSKGRAGPLKRCADCVAAKARAAAE